MYDLFEVMSFRGDLEALVLGVLQDGGLHGYEIAKRIREMGSDALSVGEGKLYPTLHGLERDGMVVAEWVPQEGRPARKVYSLTDKGRAVLVEKRRLWQAFADGVSHILSPRTNPEANRG
jgi:PadR family transcriptional regulator, regulatory protein PadR